MLFLNLKRGKNTTVFLFEKPKIDDRILFEPPKKYYGFLFETPQNDDIKREVLFTEPLFFTLGFIRFVVFNYFSTSGCFYNITTANRFTFIFFISGIIFSSYIFNSFCY